MNNAAAGVAVSTEKAVHIHLSGKVQGVGFRPFVYRLGNALNLRGWVNNTLDGVHIEAVGAPDVLNVFYQRLLTEYPEIAQVTDSKCREIPCFAAEVFSVIHSAPSGAASVLLLPDLDVCDNCRMEMNDPANPRYQYPFITCTDCGPRYSIIDALPYDRPNTAMLPFRMCPTCQREYDDPADRRFYSQTNSCPACGIQLCLQDARGNSLSVSDSAIEMAVAEIRAGSILAVKGLGGYLLMADAANEATIGKLRERKHRPDKPFALMYPTLPEIQKDVHLSASEATLLSSREKPIVILRRRSECQRIAPSVARGQNSLGIMLPYTPLHHLLLERLQRPVVATSANISGSPIIVDEATLFSTLGHVFGRALIHNREIIVPQDDGVVRVAPYAAQSIILRRSRSAAPLYPNDIVNLTDCPPILALGAEQKSTIAFSHFRNIYISQFLGELGNFDSEENFHRSITYFRKLFELQPELLVVDAHPQYAATRYGETLAHQWKVPLLRVQHHRAHFWAILAESQLLTGNDPILGIIWDGSGWGEDKAIWGGEIFRFQNGEMQRRAHIDYFPLLCGDKAAREPRLSALALWHLLPGKQDWLRRKFSSTEWTIYNGMIPSDKYHQTSSIGRVFDGVACLLDCGNRQSYEGAAAMQLEQLARKFCDGKPLQAAASAAGYYPMPITSDGRILMGEFLNTVFADYQRGLPTDKIAFKFHLSLVKLVAQLADAEKVTSLAFSGGVFQNALLVDLLHCVLGNAHRLCFHRHLSPNDENIAFGQLVAAAYHGGCLSKEKGEKHVSGNSRNG